MQNQSEIQTFLLENPNEIKAALLFLSEQGSLDRRIARLLSDKSAEAASKPIAARLEYHAESTGKTLGELLGTDTAAPRANKAGKKEVGKKDETVAVIALPSNFSAEDFAKLPEHVKEKEKAIKATHAMRSFHRAKLDEGANDKNAEHAEIIQDATELIAKLQAEINYYKEHGILPVETSDEVKLTPAEAITKLANCRARISKLKAAIKKDPKNADSLAKLADETELSKSLKLIIDAIKNGAGA
jgi:uncharacterized membrane protein